MTQNLNLGNHQLTGKSLIATVCGVALLLLMFTFLPPVLAVSYVDVINGSPNDFSLKRKNGKQKQEKEVVENGLRLEDGDTIEVLTEGSSVELILDGGSVTVTYKSSHDNPCKIGGDCTNIPPPTPFQLWISDTLDRLFGYGDTIKPAKTRGKPECKQAKTDDIPSHFIIPLLAKENHVKENHVKLLEGKRQLHFGWHGGYPPYEVSMYRQKNSSWQKISSHEVKSPDNNNNDCPEEMLLKETSMEVHNFKEGEYYRITVTYEKGKTEGYFTVVSWAEDPHPKMRKKVKATAPFYQAALWLAEQGNGEWKLEAYQKVSKDVDNTYSGWLVRLGLADGVQ